MATGCVAAAITQPQVTDVPNKEITADTNGNHDFTNGDVVTISGVFVESHAKYPDTSRRGVRISGDVMASSGRHHQDRRQQS